MNDFIITTETAADLPKEFLEENNIGTLSLYYTIDGETYGPGYPGQQTDEEFYARMREGAMPKTMQVNPEQAYSRFKTWLDQGKDILHIALTSAVSGSYNSARVAAEELQEEYPDRKIMVIDSLVGTICEGMVVDKASQMKSAGKTMEEIVGWIKENIQHFCLYATVDDLKHLYRGGRVSKMTSMIGTALGVKPILYLAPDGNLVPCGKVRGRKQSLNTLVESMEKLVSSFRAQNDTIYISHGDCIEDAKYVAKLVEEKFGIKRCIMNFIGPTIGAHAGPGALALSFMGDHK